jgi:hypothetical protein
MLPKMFIFVGIFLVCLGLFKALGHWGLCTGLGFWMLYLAKHEKL